MTDNVGDDNDLLDLGDDDDEGGPVAGVIPEDERVMPQIVETVITDEQGNRSYVDEELVAPWLYVEATRDLPGWDLWSVPAEAVTDFRTRQVTIPARTNRGWIPNDEEGANAIALGWARLIDVPEGVEQPPAPERPPLT